MNNADVAQTEERRICNAEVARSTRAIGITLTAHQGQYLPGLRLLAKIAQADLFCVFDAVQFERHSFESRNWIKTQNGIQLLTVPVESRGHFAKTGGNIRIVQNGWQRKHLRAIELAYWKAPYFWQYFVPLKAILSIGTHGRLTDLNRVLLAFAMRSFGIETPVTLASAHGFTGAKSALVLDMCRKLGATRYIFGAMGKDYADREAFAAAGIEIEFQDYKHPVYSQLHGEFVPNMSIIDLLMNEGPASRDILLSGNMVES